ncbi:hypothetical protein L2E82_50532 [Cichorium intybus]|nr:hypothetical protein L2E82_50532 [Cichorium intybus]
MVSLEESCRSNSSITRPYPYYTPPSSSPSPSRSKHMCRSMRTIRSNFYQSDYSSGCSFVSADARLNDENLIDSVINVRLQELATTSGRNRKSPSQSPSHVDRIVSHPSKSPSVTSSDSSLNEPCESLPSASSIRPESPSFASWPPICFLQPLFLLKSQLG